HVLRQPTLSRRTGSCVQWSEAAADRTKARSRETPACPPGLAFSARQVPVSVPHRAVPMVDVSTNLIDSVAVAVLDLAFELLPSALDGIEVLIGELGPFLLDPALELLPVALEAVPIGCRLQGADRGLHRVGCGPRDALPQLARLGGPGVHLRLGKFGLQLNELFRAARPQQPLRVVERVRDRPGGERQGLLPELGRLLVEARQAPVRGREESVERLPRLTDAVLGEVAHSEGAEVRHPARLLGALLGEIAHPFRQVRTSSHANLLSWSIVLTGSDRPCRSNVAGNTWEGPVAPDLFPLVR